MLGLGKGPVAVDTQRVFHPILHLFQRDLTPKTAQTGHMSAVAQAGIEYVAGRRARILFGIHQTYRPVQSSRRLERAINVQTPQVRIVGIVRLPVVFAVVEKIVVVHVGPVVVNLRVNIVHEEGLKIVRCAVEVAILVGITVLIFVEAGEDAIDIGLPEKEEVGDGVVGEPTIGKTILVVVVLDQPVNEGIVVRNQAPSTASIITADEGAQLGVVIGPH